jgi:NhaP-type Na+/H+ or K+/H+ antiporter
MWTIQWAALDLVWRIAAGIAVGWAVGRAGAWYVFEREADAPIEEIDEESESADQPKYSTSEGLIVLGTLLLAYGLAELAEGYGFLAVFVGAVTARQRENRSRYHKLSHHFIDQIEQIVLVLVLFGFGAMLASGVLASLTWEGAAIGLALIFIIRPLSGLLSESFCGLPLPGKLAVAFLGVRGMGSIYYLAYGQNHGNFYQFDQLWAIASFTILVSIVVHGIVAGPFIRLVEERCWHIHDGEDEGLESHSPGSIAAPSPDKI